MGQILAAEQLNASAMPSRATFYRLVERVSRGPHTFGSARTRRSLAKQPEGPFGTVTAARPGEWMQVDRAELTWLIDLATRTLAAAVLRADHEGGRCRLAAGPCAHLGARCGRVGRTRCGCRGRFCRTLG